MSKIIELRDKITEEPIYPVTSFNLVTDFKGSNIYGIFENSSNTFTRDSVTYSLNKVSKSNQSIKSLVGINTDDSTKDLSECILENEIVTKRIETLDDTVEIIEENYISKEEELYTLNTMKNLVDNVLNNSVAYIQSGTPLYAPVIKEIRTDDNNVYFGINGLWYTVEVDSIIQLLNFNIQGQTLKIFGADNAASINNDSLKLNNPGSIVTNNKLKIN